MLSEGVISESECVMNEDVNSYAERIRISSSAAVVTL